MWSDPVPTPPAAGPQEYTALPSGCLWPVSYVNCSEDGLPPAIASLPDERREIFEQMAADYLRAWTGYGLCPVTVRPCRSECTQGISTWNGLPAPFTPMLVEGKWYNIACGVCGDDCGCGTSPALKLPGPVDSVTRVVADGELLDGGYRIDNWDLLVRTDGGRWPTCQDMSAPVDEGGFEISYLRGRPVPIGGQAAAGMLAEQFAKAFCNDSSCQLPRRVQSISRQGVTVAVLDAFSDIDTGHTGIWVIDAWIASVTRSARTSRVYSPDRPSPRYRVQTWPRG